MPGVAACAVAMNNITITIGDKNHSVFKIGCLIFISLIAEFLIACVTEGAAAAYTVADMNLCHEPAVIFGVV